MITRARYNQRDSVAQRLFVEGNRPERRRLYVNQTTKNLRIVDSANSELIVPIEGTATNFSNLERGFLYVFDVYNGYAENCSLYIDPTPFSTTREGERFVLSHRIPEKNIAQSERFFHDRLTDTLVVSPYYKGKITHPALSTFADREGLNANSLGFVIEVYDPSHKYPVAFVRVGDVVHRLNPIREENTFGECVRTVRLDPETDERTEEHSSLEVMFEGEGYEGIRLYTNIIDARKDSRAPDFKERQITEKERETIKAAAYKDARKQIFETELKDEVNKRTKELEDELIKVKEENRKRREKSASDRSGLISAVAKTFNLLWGLISGLFAAS